MEVLSSALRGSGRPQGHGGGGRASGRKTAQSQSEVRTFDTTTPGLLALSAWLAEHGCTHVAMEATGVYWKPVWHVLSDGDFTLILANAAHVKNVPGPQDRCRATRSWLAELLAHGLIRAELRAGGAIQEMRA